MATIISIEDNITVGALAEQLKLPVSKLVGELFKNGIVATVNERIDADTAQIIVEELGIDVEFKEKDTTEKQESYKRPEASDKAQKRPPVVAVMGHVDHGKTSLLDAIRGGSVASDEAGGITQHISAYMIEHGGRSITFLDTPGHEAFAAIREHGADLTDISIIVVAADDGVKPQTIEAIRFARKAGSRIVVAINKIDKEGADINRVKQELSEQDLMPEEWGGDTVMVEVSAKTKQGIDKLLDMILLVADVEDLRADIDVPASGLVIEAKVVTGRGPVAQVLVGSGELRSGMYVVAGSTFAKIRNLERSGKPIKSATPSSPATITGFKTLPDFGDQFVVVKNERLARQMAEQEAIKQKKIISNASMSSSDLMRIINRADKLEEFNVLIKADVQGSLTSVMDAIKSLDTDEVAVRIVGTGVGIVNESDIYLANSSNATIYGFNVTLPANVRRLASRDNVPVKMYKIIYELIDDVKIELSKRLAPEVIETDQGRLVVRGIFKTTKSEIICGGEVTKGHLIVPSLAKIIRDGKEIANNVEVTRLQRGPQETKEVLEGEMCGMSLKTDQKLTIQEGDHVEAFTREIVSRSLS